MSQGAPSCSLSVSFPFPPSKRQARSQIQLWVRCKLIFCSENLHLRVCLSFWVLYSKISIDLQSLLMMHIAKHGFISLGLVYRFWIVVPQKVSSISYHIISYVFTHFNVCVNTILFGNQTMVLYSQLYLFLRRWNHKVLTASKRHFWAVLWKSPSVTTEYKSSMICWPCRNISRFLSFQFQLKYFHL